MVFKYILAALIGYALGNIPSGVLIARIFGVGDVRKYGSGNSGTTNVLRTVGWLPSVRSTLVEPELPLPCLRMSHTPNAFDISTPTEMLPSR